MKRILIFKRGVREVRNGFRLVDLVWQKFNRAKDRFLLFVAGKYMPKVITPNRLSWARICFAVAIAVLLFQYTQWRRVIIGLFIAAVMSDIFDGPTARARQLVSRKGAFLDRIGDKLLICPLVARLAWEFDRLLVLMLVGSEILSMTIAILAMRRRVSTQSNWLGKWKMFGQSLGVGILFFFPQATAIASKTLWVALGIGLASLLSHFQSYITSRPPENK